MEKAFYMINYKAVACFFDIQINEVSICSMNMDKQLTTTIPINYLILESGLQKVSVKLLPILGESLLNEETDFSMKIQLFEVEPSFRHKEDILEYQISLENEEIKSLPVLIYETSFNADVPFRLTAWQNSLDLRDISNLNELVDKIYKKITSTINEKQYDKFIEMLYEREENMSKSLYLSSKEKEDRMQELIADFENGFKLIPLSEDDSIQFYNKGKVIRLIKRDGESAIRFFSEETGEEMTLEILFHLKDGATELSII